MTQLGNFFNQRKRKWRVRPDESTLDMELNYTIDFKPIGRALISILSEFFF